MRYYFYVISSYFECWRYLKVIYDIEKVKEIKINSEEIIGGFEDGKTIMFRQLDIVGEGGNRIEIQSLSYPEIKSTVLSSISGFLFGDNELNQYFDYTPRFWVFVDQGDIYSDVINYFDSKFPK